MGSIASFAALLTPSSANAVPTCEFTLPPPPPIDYGGDPVSGGGGCGGHEPPNPPARPPNPNTPKQAWCDDAALTLLAAALALVIIDAMTDGVAISINAKLWAGINRWANRGVVGGGVTTVIAGCFGL